MVDSFSGAVYASTLSLSVHGNYYSSPQELLLEKKKKDSGLDGVINLKTCFHMFGEKLKGEKVKEGDKDHGLSLNS